MTVFIQELRRLRGQTIGWSLTLGILIIMALPVYVGMISGNAGNLPEQFMNSEMFELYNTTIEIIMRPIGTFSFLTSFILLAVAVHGTAAGIKMFTVEYHTNSYDFLLTKPVSRGSIFLQKFLAGCASGLTIALTFSIASMIAMRISTSVPEDPGVLLLISFSLFFLFLEFMAVGMLIGVAAPKTKSPMVAAFAVMFAGYVLTTFSAKTGVAFLGWISPFTYFKGAEIITLGGYRLSYGILSASGTLALLVTGRLVFRKRDIPVHS